MKQVPVVQVVNVTNLQQPVQSVPITTRRVATRTQKRSCVHIENVDKNENMVNLGHKVE
jgi:hypothetical protein